MDAQYDMNRRRFLRTAGATAAAGSVLGGPGNSAPLAPAAVGDKPALLGGSPVREGAWPSWPQSDQSDADILMRSLEEKRWCYLRPGAHFCKDFEQMMSRDYGGAHVMLTNAGTNALHTCLYVLDVGPGDEVLVPGASFIATLQSIVNLFALPIFIDVDPTTGMMDPALLEAAITPRTKAILPVHLFGASCDMDGIMAVARKHGLHVVEDACQAPYVEWGGRKLGTIGDCGAISYNVWKTLGCGDGGAIVTTRDDLGRACDAFRNNGRDPQGGSNGPGFMGMNYRPTELQAALLLTQTERFKKQAPIRRRNAEYLTAGLRDFPGLEPLRVPPKTGQHNYYNYMVRYDADAMGGLPIEPFTRALQAEGIHCGSHPDGNIMAADRHLSRLLASPCLCLSLRGA